MLKTYEPGLHNHIREQISSYKPPKDSISNTAIRSRAALRIRSTFYFHYVIIHLSTSTGPRKILKDSDIKQGSLP